MRADHRVRWVPETLQSSLMDCGPAALTSVLRGFGIDADYDAIRERCQTDVDGTSIFQLAKLGAELGLSSAQVLVPRDHLLLPSAACLPAIAVTQEAAGLLHFVVVWETHGPLVQVMDPSVGRTFQRRSQFLSGLPDVPIAISKERFARWRKTGFARNPLRHRVQRLGVGRTEAEALVSRACDASEHHAYAKLDAATRMLTTLVEGKAVARGREASQLLQSVLDRAAEDGIPISFWWVWEGSTPSTLSIRGAPIVHFAWPAQANAAARDAGVRASRCVKHPVAVAQAELSVVTQNVPAHDNDSGELSRSLRDHMRTRGLSPWPLLWRMLSLNAPSAPLWLGVGVLLAAALSFADLLVVGGVMQASRHLVLSEQRVFGALALCALALLGLALEMWLAHTVGRIGRSLELRVRGALFEKLPRLPDSYLRTRSTSDMAQRGHALHLLRGVPNLARRALEAVALLAGSVAGIGYLFPQGLAASVCAGVATVLVPFILSRPAAERALRARTHMVALDRFYLDALLGVVPIRVHGAESSVRREHETLLTQWVHASLGAHAHSTATQAVHLLLAAALNCGLCVAYLAAQLPAAGLLLLAYWSTRMPAAGAALVDTLVAYRALQHAVVRILSPLGAATTERSEPPRVPSVVAADPASQCATERSLSLPAEGTPDAPLLARVPAPHGVAISLRDASVRIANRELLRKINLEIRSGEHVAIVGPSGAGKSSLASLLLGWLTLSAGTLEIDGGRLSAQGLRQYVAWVDPSIQLWNDTLLQNLLYGADDVGAVEHLADVMRSAELGDILQALPDGLQSRLGEAGACVSGGQGQRVRLARSLMRADARLVLLDEPFRGLPRKLRQQLLSRVRERFRGASLLFISHDIGDTREFARVLVVESGTIVEDGAPSLLLDTVGSRYSALLRAHDEQSAFAAGAWRHAQMHAGSLREIA